MEAGWCIEPEKEPGQEPGGRAWKAAGRRGSTGPRIWPRAAAQHTGATGARTPRLPQAHLVDCIEQGLAVEAEGGQRPHGERQRLRVRGVVCGAERARVRGSGDAVRHATHRPVLGPPAICCTPSRVCCRGEGSTPRQQAHASTQMARTHMHPPYSRRCEGGCGADPCGHLVRQIAQHLQEGTLRHLPRPLPPLKLLVELQHLL